MITTTGEEVTIFEKAPKGKYILEVNINKEGIYGKEPNRYTIEVK